MLHAGECFLTQQLGSNRILNAQVLEAASAQATAQMVAERGNLVERLAEVEDWHILPLGGAFISAVPSRSVPSLKFVGKCATHTCSAVLSRP